MVSAPASPVFRLLGAVEFAGPGGRPGRFSRAQHRDLLALLLLQVDRLVCVEQMIEDLWGGRPPVTAAAQVQNMVSALRRALNTAAAPARIEHRRGSYALRTDRELVDADRFAALLARARQAEPADAAWPARAALALWQGRPLADVRAPFADQARAALTEQRAQAFEVLFAAELSAGRHAEILPELATRVREFPLRERLTIQWLTALYRSGLRIDALAAYRTTVQTLAEEYGLEPGPQLRDLELRMLRGEPIGDRTGGQTGSESIPSSGTPGTVTRHAAPPNQLPADITAFVGRDDIVAELDALAAEEAPPGTPRIAAITGTAGAGKTALAVRWAHRVASRFPDGQLYLDLRGYDPSQRLPTARALAVLLHDLGVDDIPDDLAGRSARYRSTVSGRRVLVVLDNAASAEQARALMPGDGAGVTLVTSRDSLAGLVARHGARRIEVPPLPADRAAELLHRLIGRRADADPAAISLLAARCAFLPLALRVAAEFIASRPAIPLDHVGAELADADRRLDLLDAGGDERTGIQAVFSWSYRHLPPRAAAALRHLGLHPGSRATPEALAALLDSRPAEAADLLRVLRRAHLVEEPVTDSYQMHDLMRAYARRLARDEPAEQSRAARTRLAHYYLASAGAAMDRLFPHERHRRPAPPAGAAPADLSGCDRDARDWLDRERENLLALARSADPEVRIALSQVLWRHLDANARHDDAAVLHTAALRAARRLGDPVAEASALLHLGLRCLRLGRSPAATDQFTRALARFDAAGERTGQAEAHKYLAIVAAHAGERDRALAHSEHALAIFQAEGDHAGTGMMLGNLGVLCAQLGRYTDALRHFERALDLHRAVGDRAGEARTMINIGELHARQGDDAGAVAWQRRALSVFRRAGDRAGEAAVLGHLGDLYRRGARYAPAVRHHQQALVIARESGDRHGEGEVRDRLGHAYHQWGRPEEAIRQYRAALEISLETGDQAREISVRNGLGAALRATGRYADAGGQHRRALDLATAAGDPYEQARARDGLAALPASTADGRRQA